ncbi:hypothetical protein RUM44_004269 [Polyplax serrata]|uniref:DUF4789 domain-containing protein n=1 Tax=Polyplax serrata TaxID=468196 RepID=A0ABR1B2C4_POLSC
MRNGLLTLSFVFVCLFHEGHFRSIVTDKEFECYSEEKIYHKPTDKCYKLLTTGPCQRGHWFVLEKPRGTVNATIKATCAREICQDGEYYWPKTNSCVRAADKKKLCGDNTGEELVTNVFGEGECICTRDPPRARLKGDRTNRCYLLYTQGPCLPTQVFGYSDVSEEASCISDPCYTQAVYKRRNKLIPKDAILAPWENGTCFELGTRGPCPEGLTFKVHAKRRNTYCRALLNQIFGGVKPCDLDVNGNCQQKATQKKRSTADRYMKELEMILNKK